MSLLSYRPLASWLRVSSLFLYFYFVEFRSFFVRFFQIEIHFREFGAHANIKDHGQNK